MALEWRTVTGVRSVLWIDDEVAPEDALVSLVRDTGIRIDTAQSLARAFTLADGRSYDCIILDLRLPDGDGLHFLRTLRSRGVTAAVVILSGYADMNIALDAGRLGVGSILEKPVSSDDLIAAIQHLKIVKSEPAQSHLVQSSSHAQETMKQEAWRQFCDLSGYPQGIQARSRCSLDGLLNILVLPALPVKCFVACAAWIRHLTTEQSYEDVVVPARVLALLKLPDTSDTRVLAAIAALRAAIVGGCLPRQAAIARSLGVERSHLSHMFVEQTGLSFREWRRAISLGLAVARLSEPSSRINQCAYRVGFEHAGEFSRECRNLFGMSPRRLRALLSGRNS